MKKNLLFYCFSHDLDDIDEPTRLALKCLRTYGDCFDGKKVVFIGSDDPDGVDRTKASSLFEFLDDVRIEFVQNDPETRESQHFIDLLSTIEDMESMSFYAHNKGSTHQLDDGLFHWIHLMYFFNLSVGVLPSIEEAMQSKTISGIFRKNAACDMHGMHSDWHYSGAFFWFNMQRLTSHPEWKNAKKHRMGLEFYPSSIISVSDSHCSFGGKDHNFDMTLGIFDQMLEHNEHAKSYALQTDSIWKK